MTKTNTRIARQSKIIPVSSATIDIIPTTEFARKPILFVNNSIMKLETAQVATQDTNFYKVNAFCQTLKMLMETARGSPKQTLNFVWSVTKAFRL